MRSMAQKNPGLAFIFGDLFANIEKQKQ
jgi:hypothetical protein